MATDNYQIRVQSLEYLPVRVRSFKLGAPYDPTNDVVKIALPVIDVDPVTGDWKSATWQTVDDEYYANLLVGPGGDVTLQRGDYDIFIKVTDSPEIPVIRAGRLSII